MSIALVRRATALVSGDGQMPDDELAEIFAPDVVLDLSARIFNPYVYEGYDGLRQFHAESREIWESVDMTIREIVEEGDRYLVIAAVGSRGRGSGVPIDAEAAGIWTVADGRLKHYQLLQPLQVDREAALAALRDQTAR